MAGLLQRLVSAWTPQGVCVPDYLAARARGDGAVERRFHEQLLLRNGVYRTTSERRLDATFAPLIEAARGLPAPVRVLDVAVSMGVATVELHAALTGAGLACETLGTDLIVAGEYVSRGDGCGLLFDPEGAVLQADVGGFATPWRLRPSDRLLRGGLVARATGLMEREAGAFREALSAPVAGFAVTPVPLLHRSTDGVRGLRFAQESLLEPREMGPFGVIRAANILNGDYFGPETLLRMVEGLRARLLENGTLLVARNLPGETLTRATWFRHEQGALRAVGEINGGSEVAALLAG